MNKIESVYKTKKSHPTKRREKNDPPSSSAEMAGASRDPSKQYGGSSFCNWLIKQLSGKFRPIYSWPKKWRWREQELARHPLQAGFELRDAVAVGVKSACPRIIWSEETTEMGLFRCLMHTQRRSSVSDRQADKNKIIILSKEWVYRKMKGHTRLINEGKAPRRTVLCIGLRWQTKGQKKSILSDQKKHIFCWLKDYSKQTMLAILQVVLEGGKLDE